MEENKLLPCPQLAYRRFHSTDTALLKVFLDFTDAMDRGEAVLLCLLDMSCAFDMVDFNILLDRLRIAHGIEGSALKWISSYVFERSQIVIVYGVHSAT